MQALFRVRWRTALILTAALTVSGCSLLSEPGLKRPVEPAVEPEQPPALPPLASHRFEFDPEQDDVVGQLQITVATAEDTLPDIARRFNLGYEEILRANPGVDPWLPGAGREIVLPTQFVLPNAPREGVVINVPAMRLFYFPAQPKPPGAAKKASAKDAAKAAAAGWGPKAPTRAVVITHPIGIGKIGWATPEGTTKILRRTKDPTWRVPLSVRKEHEKNGDPLPAVVPPGPDNPLGAHSFTLGWPSYLIHGTNKPYGVGMRSSHGCIRLYPEDIAQLFDLVPIGTKVHVVNQPFLFGRHEQNVLIQPYGMLEDDKRDWAKNHRKLLDKTVTAPIREALKQQQQEIDWAYVEMLLTSARGVPIPVTRPLANDPAATPVTVESVIVAAQRVENTLPQGATWNGHIEIDHDKLMDVLSDREPVDTAGAIGGPGSAAPAGGSQN